MQKRRIVEDDLITGYWDSPWRRAARRVFGPEEELGKGVRVARVALDLGQLGRALGRAESRRCAGPKLAAGFQYPGLPAAHRWQERVAIREPLAGRTCAAA